MYVYYIFWKGGKQISSSEQKLLSVLDIIQRKNPETEFDILKQIGSGTYGEVYKVSYDYNL